MAWRPYQNLIDGELDNRIPGQVTGWMRFYRRDAEPLRVTFNLEGDFHEDTRGKRIRLHNPHPSDRADALGRDGTYMKGFAEVQEGDAGDMTAGLSLGPWTEELAARAMQDYELAWSVSGLSDAERDRRRREYAAHFRKRIEARDPFYPYVPYPYLEWYSEANGRVVLELDDSQVSVVDGGVVLRGKMPQERGEARRKREDQLIERLGGVVQDLSLKNRENGDDGGVISAIRS